MSDSSIQQVSPNNTALNAEHYQTFEMAKANDDVLGGNDIAQIRSYAAYARAQAQAIHKTIAATSGIDDVAAIKEEATETAQTFAKVGIYADQRIGEILRELPTSKGGRPKNSSDAQEEFTKANAITESGISKSQAYDLQAMAANPEVVEAVIAKAEAEGRIVSRSQVLKAIKERDEARKDAEEVSELYGKVIIQRDEAKEDLASERAKNLELGSQIANLRHQASEKPEPEVIERKVEVVREVVPEETRKTIRELERSNKQFSEDYEDLRRRFSNTQAELKQARSELATNEAALSSIREIQALTRAMGEFVGRYSGHAWPFADVDEQTMGEFARTLGSLSAFVNELKKDIHMKEES